MRTCATCHAPLAIMARRHARYCSARCRATGNRATVPAELRARDRWVRHDRHKRPLTLAGSLASVADPGTWASYAAVRSHTRKGFVLNGDGIVALDLDRCLDAEGAPTPWAARILDGLPATYIERSPSGRGLHVWGTGTLARSGILNLGHAVEAYATGRYLTVTGARYGRTNALADLTEAVAALTV